MAAAITDSELEVAAILQSLSDFFHGTEDLFPSSSLNSIRWGAKRRRSTGMAPDARCKARGWTVSPPPPPHFRNPPSPQPPPPLVAFELSPALAQIDVGGEKKPTELDEAAAGTGSPVSPLYFDQLRECADHRRKAPSPPSVARPMKKSRVQHKDWVRAQTSEISRLREEKRVLTQKAEAARIHHDALLAENSRLKQLKSRISDHPRSHQPAPPLPTRRVEIISFPIERKPSPQPTREPESRAELSIPPALFASYPRQRVEIPRQRVEIPDLNCYEEAAPPPQPQQHQKPLWVAPPLERHLYRFEGATPEEKRAATAAARRRRVEIKRRKAAAAAASLPVTAVSAAV